MLASLSSIPYIYAGVDHVEWILFFNISFCHVYHSSNWNKACWAAAKKMADRVRLLILLVSLALAIPVARGYFVSVDAHVEECFFDRASSGMKMGLTFEVVEGGFLDIDVKVCCF